MPWIALLAAIRSTGVGERDRPPIREFDPLLSVDRNTDERIMRGWQEGR